MDPMQPFDPRHFVKGARDVQYGHKLNLITGKTGLILDLVIWRSLRGCPFSESRSVWMPLSFAAWPIIWSPTPHTRMIEPPCGVAYWDTGMSNSMFRHPGLYWSPPVGVAMWLASEGAKPASTLQPADTEI